MGFKDKLKGLADKARPAAEKAKVKGGPIAQKAAAKLDEKTKGKYHDQIEKASHKAGLGGPEADPAEGASPPPPPPGEPSPFPATPENPGRIPPGQQPPPGPPVSSP